MSVSSLLSPKNIDFSKNDQAICDYILQHPQKTKLMTIQKLASNTGTSIAAVQRFCAKLSFNGFKEFKQVLAKELELEKAGNPQHDFLKEYQEAIIEFQSLDLSLLIDKIKKSRIIFSTGIYYSSLPAKQLHFALIDLHKPSLWAEGFTSMSHLLPSATKDDTIIFFSINGDLSDNFKGELSPFFAENPNTFLITMNPATPLKQFFKNIIVLPGKSFNFHSSIDSQSIACLFVELLINQLDQNPL